MSGRANRAGPSATTSAASNRNQIPNDILHDPVLNHRIAVTLPENYNFEIHKTIWRLRKIGAKRVCLQFPDGLFIFAVPIVNLLKDFLPSVEFVIAADTVYGACCVDDLKARELGCDMLVHYGHSCLVPINKMVNGVSVLYVFVDIKFDVLHLIQMVAKNFNPDQHRICLAATIQFISSTHVAARELRDKHRFDVTVPQSKPLTPGEILGCTAPFLDDSQLNTLIFVADGRFHLEALMIANPDLPAYRYNPYNKELTREYYSYDHMIEQRTAAVTKMERALRDAEPIAIVLGTLGRQGSPQVLRSLRALIRSVSVSPITTYLIAEISPQLLREIGQKRIKAWIQIGCPRLSIDWGDAFVDRPLLSPYELRTAVRNLQAFSGFGAESQSSSSAESADKCGGNRNTRRYDTFTKDKRYHMDFYATKSLGSWTPSHKCHDDCECDR